MCTRFAREGEEVIRKTLLMAAFCIVGLSVPKAEAVIVYATGPNDIAIPGLTGFATTGALMDGLEVTATFANGFTETVTWAAGGGPDAGGVTGTGWSLSVDGDTFTAPWVFDFAPGVQLQLASLFLDGLNALTVFDRTEPSFGTDGSAQGRDWDCVAGNCNDALVTYDYEVSIGAAAAVGDLWQTVLVDFGDMGPRGGFSFVQDTDNDIRRGGPIVPEPGTLALLGAGLAGVRFLSRRRQA
jgi:hypothetical protein